MSSAADAMGLVGGNFTLDDGADGADGPRSALGRAEEVSDMGFCEDIVGTDGAADGDNCAETMAAEGANDTDCCTIDADDMDADFGTGGADTAGAADAGFCTRASLGLSLGPSLGASLGLLLDPPPDPLLLLLRERRFLAINVGFVSPGGSERGPVTTGS
jgi:hypothetical protein